MNLMNLMNPQPSDDDDDDDDNVVCKRSPVASCVRLRSCSTTLEHLSRTQSVDVSESVGTGSALLWERESLVCFQNECGAHACLLPVYPMGSSSGPGCGHKQKHSKSRGWTLRLSQTGWADQYTSLTPCVCVCVFACINWVVKTSPIVWTSTTTTNILCFYETVVMCTGIFLESHVNGLVKRWLKTLAPEDYEHRYWCVSISILVVFFCSQKTSLHWDLFPC